MRTEQPCTDWALDQFRAQYEGTPSPAPREKVAGTSRPDEGALQDGAPKAKRSKAANSATAVAGGAIPSSGPAGHLLPQAGEGERPITKDAIFHYVYAVLHDPIYREKYAQNLKREFPRIPFYENFWRWADWGERLMALHIGYETVEPWPLERIDTPDEKSRKAGLAPKPMLIPRLGIDDSSCPALCRASTPSRGRFAGRNAALYQPLADGWR